LPKENGFRCGMPLWDIWIIGGCGWMGVKSGFCRGSKQLAIVQWVVSLAEIGDTSEDCGKLVKLLFE